MNLRYRDTGRGSIFCLTSYFHGFSPDNVDIDSVQFMSSDHYNNTNMQKTLGPTICDIHATHDKAMENARETYEVSES